MAHLRDVTTPQLSPPPPDAAPAPHQGRPALCGALLTALGVVYGDIGTSPLYALRECFHGPHALAPTPAHILGVLSLICWALLVIITLKYVAFILRADNHGEGGILALTALATPIPRLLPSPRRGLVLLGVCGAALLYGDGIVTPAISVLSAVEGLQVATPQLTPYVLPLTVGLLVGLFGLQRRGTARLGRLFGPLMLLWFGVLAVLGGVHVAQHPAVLQAFHPAYAIAFLRTQGWAGVLVLGTVFLVVTGGEALYADLGHVGRRPIRLAWGTLVLPALLLNYLGQGALLLRLPEATAHPFYLLAPAWALYPLVGLATLATIIASQALITGAFSLTMQAENLGFLPRLRIIHTSAQAYGQIYIPVVNWALLLACLLVVVGFRTSSHLAAAYGVAVTSTMAITTLLFAVVARVRWGWRWPVLAGFLGVFLSIDSVFLGANLVKIPHGGWFPLVVAGLLVSIMATWKRGSFLVWQREQDLELPLDELLAQLAAAPPLRPPGPAIVLSANPAGAPAALLANLKYNGVVHAPVLLTTVQIADVPRVPVAERVTVDPLGQDVYRVLIRYGFMDEPQVPQALARLTLPGVTLDPDRVPYFVNRTRAIATARPGMARWREHLYSVLRQNAASPTDFFGLPPTRVVELGTSIEM
jgi:KUP system potassium uptake protein